MPPASVEVPFISQKPMKVSAPPTGTQDPHVWAGVYIERAALLQDVDRILFQFQVKVGCQEHSRLGPHGSVREDSSQRMFPGW